MELKLVIILRGRQEMSKEDSSNVEASLKSGITTNGLVICIYEPRLIEKFTSLVKLLTLCIKCDQSAFNHL